MDDDPLEPHVLENLRRSIVMMRPGGRQGLDRDKALLVIAELQRLQRQDRRYQKLLSQLRAVIATFDGQPWQ